MGRNRFKICLEFFYVYLYDVQRNLKQCTVSAISKMGVFPVGSDFCQAPDAFYLDPSTKGGIKNGQETLIFTLFI